MRRSLTRIGISRKIFSPDKIPTSIFIFSIDSFEVREEEESGHRSINSWAKSQEKIEELFYALAFHFAVSFFDI